MPYSLATTTPWWTSWSELYVITWFPAVRFTYSKPSVNMACYDIQLSIHIQYTYLHAGNIIFGSTIVDIIQASFQFSTYLLTITPDESQPEIFGFRSIWINYYPIVYKSSLPAECPHTVYGTANSPNYASDGPIARPFRDCVIGHEHPEVCPP